MKIFENFRRSLQRRVTPRFAYMHIFIEDGSTSSMLHVQNPFAFFWPEGNPAVKVRIALNTDTGKKLGMATKMLPPFGTLPLSIGELLLEMNQTCTTGTITVDLVPSPDYKQHLQALSDGLSRIASPFWMRFHDELGSQAYVHSIEADRTRIRGIPRIVSRIITCRDTSTVWSSDRTISLDFGESATAFIVNHSRRVHSCSASWVSPHSGVVTSERFSIQPKGLVQFRTEHVGEIFLSVDKISTSNAKPYVMVQSSDTRFALTHG